VDDNGGRDHHEDEDGEMNMFWGFPAPEKHQRGPTSTRVTVAWWSSKATSWAAGGGEMAVRGGRK
jgi:hypothetical protein